MFHSIITVREWGTVEMQTVLFRNNSSNMEASTFIKAHVFSVSLTSALAGKFVVII